MHLHKRGVATVLAVLMAVQATGCHSWRTVWHPVPAAVAQYPNRKIQVVLTSAPPFTADSAKTAANTLIAYRRTGVDTIPLSEVKEVKVLEFNELKVVGLVVGALAVFVVAIGLCAAVGACNPNGDSR